MLINREKRYFNILYDIDPLKYLSSSFPVKLLMLLPIKINIK